jgi:hypothetical protein
MCDFCNAMATHKKVDSISRDYFPEASYRYSVAIVQRTFVKGRRGSQGRTTDYRYRGCGYKLNYCPECGTKLGRKGDDHEQT